MTRGKTYFYRAPFGVFFFSLTFSGCTRLPSNESTASAERPTTVATSQPPVSERVDFELQSEIERIAAVSGGKIGVGAVMVETGDAVWVNRAEKFPSQSVYKLPIAMTVLRMIGRRQIRLDQPVAITRADFVRRGFHSPIRNANPAGTVMPLGDIIRYSISESDGTASDVLLDIAGGPKAVQQYLSEIGIADFIVADSEKSISKDWETQYRNWATPQASIALLQAINDRTAQLDESTITLLIGVMTESDTGGKRLRRGLPAGATIAHKTGTGGRPSEIPGADQPEETGADAETTSKAAKTSRSAAEQRREIKKEITSATNDIGIITLPDGRRILIAVYLTDSAADSWTRNRVLSEIARVVTEKWTIGSFVPSDLPASVASQSEPGT